MSESEATESASRAVRIARSAWERAHRGLPSPAMTRTADVVATATIAASVLTRLHLSDEELETEATEAIVVARRISQQTRVSAPGNPMLRTAERAAVGILAAGILNRRHD